MKDLFRPTLALLLAMPLGLIGQTTPNADPSQVTKTYKELVSEIDNYYKQDSVDGKSQLEFILSEALCADEKDLFLQGDVLFQNSFAGITISFESCIDREDLTDQEKAENCATDH